jgi:hypothetical protein
MTDASVLYFVLSTEYGVHRTDHISRENLRDPPRSRVLVVQRQPGTSAKQLNNEQRLLG